MFLSNPEAKNTNTIFMGPLTHRETRLDAYLNQKKDVKWSEEAENEYLESVKSRATEKVRALLLQAKRRSDEIVQEAELHAQEITAQAEKKAQEIEQKAQAALGDAEQRYQDVYHEAVRKGHEEIQQILAQNQQILGESTAVVLLSIHEQIAKFYDVWKEDLKQLTLDAIEVGTGWVANTEKEAILKQLLDESVQKLIDKKNFIVRVNPADAELITQVLENSREKNWSMESSKELEPGSLELESDNVYVKNSRSERQKFVQDILDNLVLPRSGEEELLTKHVKDTLNREMQNNPVLSHSMQQTETPVAEIPLEKMMPDTEHPPIVPPAEHADNEEILTGAPSEQSVFTPETQELMTEQDMPESGMQTEAAQDFAGQASAEPNGNAPAGMEEILQEQNQTSAAENPVQPQKPNQAPPSAQEIDDSLFDAPQMQTEQRQEPIEVIEELPTFSSPDAHTEAQDLVDEFLGNEPKQESLLPSDLADDLLAEMGFDSKQ